MIRHRLHRFRRFAARLLDPETAELADRTAHALELLEREPIFVLAGPADRLLERKQGRPISREKADARAAELLGGGDE